MNDSTDSGSTGPTGRTKFGRFSPGNTYGRGNPHNRRAQRLRAAVMRAATPADVADVLRAMILMAKGGDVGAARLVLERTCGKPRDWDDPSLPFVSGDPQSLLEAAQRTLSQVASGETTSEAAARSLSLLAQVSDLWHLPQLEQRLRQLEER